MKVFLAFNVFELFQQLFYEAYFQQVANTALTHGFHALKPDKKKLIKQALSLNGTDICMYIIFMSRIMVAKSLIKKSMLE